MDVPNLHNISIESLYLLRDIGAGQEMCPIETLCNAVSREALAQLEELSVQKHKDNSLGEADYDLIKKGIGLIRERHKYTELFHQKRDTCEISASSAGFTDEVFAQHINNWYEIETNINAPDLLAMIDQADLILLGEYHTHLLHRINNGKTIQTILDKRGFEATSLFTEDGCPVGAKGQLEQLENNPKLNKVVSWDIDTLGKKISHRSEVLIMFGYKIARFFYEEEESKKTISEKYNKIILDMNPAIQRLQIPQRLPLEK